jgi:hypothetical protein
LGRNNGDGREHDYGDSGRPNAHFDNLV